ncbi:3-oxoacyl-ACP reductase FabG [Paraburkholderia sp. J63]|uniref:3-oxoacyl-ACP reductase FabG n=1 Tax=Paraburkholderia sp. J63 TaxID=2805434 RepID=UPI002ABE2675|nr:3-oxoacyl-ACP reductase FabG [Paraburkholderia sp. J63]
MAIYPDLEGKTVVVTGASGDLGMAICRKYLALGSNVHALYNTAKAGLEALASEPDSAGRLTIAKCDVGNRDEVEQLRSELEQRVEAVDVLINNAGICKDNLVLAMTFEEFDEVVRVNLHGTFNMTQGMMRLMRHAQQASIVNVTSVAGVTASFGQSNYSAAKAGISGFTRSIAKELASKGIRVNAIAPGMIESRMVKKVPRHIARTIFDAIPLNRFGRPEEIAEVVAFLGSNASSYIVGQTLVADGGLVMR